jgi:hypothetical protein
VGQSAPFAICHLDGICSSATAHDEAIHAFLPADTTLLETIRHGHCPRPPMEAPYLSSSLQVLAKGVLPPTVKLALPLRHAPSSLKGCSVMLHCRCRDIHAAMQLVGCRERIRRVPPGHEWMRLGYVSSEQGVSPASTSGTTRRRPRVTVNLCTGIYSSSSAAADTVERLPVSWRSRC